MSDVKKITAYLGLGSNMGDREAYLKKALKLIEKEKDIEIKKVSNIYETEPWPKQEIINGRPLEKEEQNWHLNQVIGVETSLKPKELLKRMQGIEKKMGKKKKITWGSREIDIDLLLYDDQTIDTQDLKIPHPYMHQRQFVLVPLLEITPNIKNPKSKKSFREYLNQIPEEYTVRKYEANRPNKGS